MPRMSLMTDCGLAWTLSSMIDSIRVRIFPSIMFSTSASIFFSTFARGSDYPIFVTINDFLPIRSTRDVIECKIWIDYWLLSSASCVMLRTYDGFWLCPLKFFSYFSLMCLMVLRDRWPLCSCNNCTRYTWKYHFSLAQPCTLTLIMSRKLNP